MSLERVLLVHDYGGLGGGAEIVTQDLRSGLRRRGVDARLLTSSVGAEDAGPQGDAHSDFIFHGSTGPYRALREVINPSMIAVARRTLREFRPQVVHLSMIFTQVSPWILPLAADLPVVWLPQTYRPICPKGTRMLPGGTPCHYAVGRSCLSSGCFSPLGLTPRLVQLGLARRWRRAINRTVSPSLAYAAALEAHGWPVDRIIPHGVRTAVERRRPGRQPLVVFAGRLMPEKGVETLLHAFHRLHGFRPDARLLIVGGGPEQNRLTTLVQGWPSDVAAAVEFTGHLARQEAQSRLAGAWVQVVPSLWAEPFGLVTIEAMAHGTVVVASRVGAQPELVLDGVTGHLVSPNDSETLALTLRALLSDPAKLEAMGDAAAARARDEFDVNLMAGRYLELYEELIEPGVETT